MKDLIARLEAARRKFDDFSDYEDGSTRAFAVAIFATLVAIPLLDECRTALKARENDDG